MTQSRYQETRRWMDSNTSPSVTLDEKLRVPRPILLLHQNHKETVSSNIADFLNRVCTEDKSTQEKDYKKEGRMSPICLPNPGLYHTKTPSQNKWKSKS